MVSLCAKEWMLYRSDFTAAFSSLFDHQLIAGSISLTIFQSLTKLKDSCVSIMHEEVLYR